MLLFNLNYVLITYIVLKENNKPGGIVMVVAKISRQRLRVVLGMSTLYLQLLFVTGMFLWAWWLKSGVMISYDLPWDMVKYLWYELAVVLAILLLNLVCITLLARRFWPRVSEVA